MHKANAEEMLSIMQNCLSWAAEGKGRRICGVSYEPSSEWCNHYVMVQESDAGCQIVYSASDIIDVPSHVLEQKKADLARLQEELS
ncbi:MAG: hypothetical protein HGA87_01050 [Desulfobulbaceae bacterium]|nr:hypothetical protein [Desulfobulbaceae bacterium]